MGGSSKATIGFRYYMGVHTVLCHGPVDDVMEFIVGERRAWEGSITSSQGLGIDEPELFGGDKREGGVKGIVDIMMGEPTQAANPYLVEKCGGPVPAYRGLLSIVYRGVLRSFQWSSINPYFKAPWWRVRRVLKGWSDDNPWYPEKAAVGDFDMNPAHVVYECLTNRDWGMQYPAAAIDDANFRAAADTLFAEGFGVSMMWMEQTSIADFIDEVLRHVGGLRRYDIRTGKVQLKLIRDDYDVETLPELNPSNVIKIESFQRATWGEMANEVYVRFMDREQKDASTAVQNLAAIEAQGGVVSVTKNYPFIREERLATRVAMRDLQASSTPIAKISITCNRIAWDWMAGDMFNLSWPQLGLNGVPFRIVKIDKGSLTDGQIKIEAVEDLFRMPNDAYVATVPSGWIEPDQTPSAATLQRTVEAPYWDVVSKTAAADLAYLPTDYAFGEQLAVRAGSNYDFEIWNSASSGGTYSNVGLGDFCPSGTIQGAISIGAAALTFTVENGVDLDTVEVGNYAYIDDEIVGVTTINPDTGVVTVTRGVLDSVPAEHLDGTRIYFCDGTHGYDPTIRVNGETTYYKLRPVSAGGVLPIESATAVSLACTGRAHRPYPPGNLKIGGTAYPESISEPAGGIVVSWAHRDRTQQTVSLTPTTTGNIGPEPGTTYNLYLYNDDTDVLLRSVTGITTTSSTVALPTGSYNVRLELESARDGLTSWQKHIHVFAFTLTGGLYLTEAGDIFTSEAGDHLAME